MKNQPGLYDEKNNLIYTWEELLNKDLDVEKDCYYFDAEEDDGEFKNFLVDNNLFKTKVKLVVAEGIREIGYGVFGNCTNLISVELPDTLTSIGAEAFYGCIRLESVNIPVLIESIDEYTFDGCKSLKQIDFSDGIKYIGEYAFFSCEKLVQLKIPDSVESINNCAFADCADLKQVIILNPDIKVNDAVFYECSNLDEILVHEKVCVNNPDFTDEYKDKIKYFKDLTLDYLLNKDYSITEVNKLLNEFQSEER